MLRFRGGGGEEEHNVTFVLPEVFPEHALLTKKFEENKKISALMTYIEEEVGIPTKYLNMFNSNQSYVKPD